MKTSRQHIQLLRDRIAQHGFTMIGVGADDDQDGYTYTLGMQASWSHPDLIVFGLPYETALTLLGTIARRVQAGEKFSDGDVLHEVANMPLVLRRCDPDAAKLYVSQTMGQGFNYQQLVWPDGQGRMPWAPAYDTRCQQPELYARGAA